MTLMIPDSVHPDTQSSAESAFFELLRSARRSEQWVCLHSLGLGRHQTQRSGEIDFLLITEEGVFVLEVKGGRVKRKDGYWVYTNRFGHSSEDSRGPFQQARNAMYSLESRIKSHFDNGSRLSKLLLGYGVVAPDCPLRQNLEGNEGGENINLVYDSNDRREPLDKFVKRMVQATREAQTRRRFSPRESDRDDLVTFLRGDFDAVIPLSVAALNSRDQMKSLEKEQYALLDTFASNPRTIIEGAAGTGKTLIAVEHAKRMSWQKKSVLLLCFNRNLASFLNAAVVARDSSSVDVASIHSFLRGIIVNSRHADEFLPLEKEGAEDLFEQHYPRLAWEAAVEQCENKYDALIVDEAQDVLCETYLDTLDVILKDGVEGGNWTFLLDSNNQAAVYGRLDLAALNRLQRFGRTCFLWNNFRNTKPIANETKLLSSPKVFAASTIAGESVEYIFYSSRKELHRKLVALVVRLIEKEGVKPGQITILSSRKGETTEFIRQNGQFPVETVKDSNVPAVVYGQCSNPTISTVSTFKGLENDFILLVDIESLENEWWRSIVYVGMSRARACLFVFLPNELQESYRNLIHKQLEQEVNLDDNELRS